MDLPDWSELLPELLVEIALHLPLYEDFSVFRGVCTNWRAAGAAKAKLYKGLGRVPLLMLSEKDDSESNEREFYSLSKRKIFKRMPVPEAKGKKCIEVGFGWILAMSDDACGGYEVSLFNHFCSAAKIELPNTRTFPTLPPFPNDEEDVEEHHDESIDLPKDHFIQRAVLSADPLLTSNFTVFVAVKFSLGFWRNGDKSWTSLNANRGPYVCGGICYYKEKMYAIDIIGQIFAWDPYGTDTKARFILHLDEELITEYGRMPYLVESCNGELLIIVRNNTEPSYYLKTGATHFEVMRVDLVKKECKQIKGIGKDAVFLGDNAPISVAAADFPGVLKPNCIYFTDDIFFCYTCWEVGGGLDMGVYNVEDGSIERFDIESFSHICPPMWIFPSF